MPTPVNPSAQGLGQEAFGKEVSFLDNLMSLFNNVPVFSDIARSLVHNWGWDKEAATWVPRMTFILIAFTIGMIPLFIRVLTHLSMVMARFKAKGIGATGRFSTFWEVFRQYTISSPFSFTLSVYAVALFMVSLSLRLLHMDKHWLFTAFLTLIIGTLFYLLRGKNYSQIREKTQPYPLGKYKGMMNLYLTGGKRYSWIRGDIEEQREAHTIIIGPPGSGKTTKYFITGILEDAHNFCSAIVVEAKASNQEDMFKMIAPTWAATGKKVILFDPWTDDSKGVSFNPLLNLTPSFNDPKTRDVLEYVVDAIYRTYATERGAASGDAAYYADQEMSLLRGLLTISLFKPAGQRNLAAIGEVVNGTLDSVIGYINSTINLADNRGDDLAVDIRKNLMWFTDRENGRDDLKASTLRGLAGKLAVFTHPRVRPFLVNDELDMDLVFKEPALLVIKSPLNVPGASTMASIIIRLLMTRVPDKLAFGASKDFKVYFYLDELPSLSIPKFEQFCKTARSSGTGIIAAIQDETDIAAVIQAKLGINTVRGLLSNFKTQVILPGIQHGTAKYYSDSFGNIEIKTRKNVRDTRNPVDFSYVVQHQEVSLMQPDNISRMDKKAAIIVDTNERPFFIKTVPWYKSSRYKGMVKKHQNVEIAIFKKMADRVDYQSPPAPAFNMTDRNRARVAAEDPLSPHLDGTSFSAPGHDATPGTSVIVKNTRENDELDTNIAADQHLHDTGIVTGDGGLV